MATWLLINSVLTFFSTSFIFLRPRYFSKTKEKCIIAAVLSIATEVCGKMYVVYTSHAAVKDYIAVLARQKAAAAQKQASLANEHANFLFAEPGVVDVMNIEEGIDTVEDLRGQLLREKRRADAAELKIRLLEELLRATKIKYGEVVPDEDEEGASGKEKLDGLGGGDEAAAAAEGGSGVAEEKSKTEKALEKNWEFILGMLAARWHQDIIAEKSAILIAAFLIYLFELSDMPTYDLLQVMGIFYVNEFVTDVILVYVLDKYFYVPFLRLPQKNWKDLFLEIAVLSQALMTISFGLYLTFGFIQTHV